MLMLIGLIAIYSTVHFLVIQHSKTYENRTTYESIVTWIAIISISLIYIGTMNS